MSSTKKKGVPIWLNLIFGLFIVALIALLVLLFAKTTPSYKASKPNDLTPDFSAAVTETTSPWNTRPIDAEISLSRTIDNIGVSAEDSSVDNSSGYLFEDSDSRYLAEYELYDMSAWDLRVARNEIYARHGRMFEDEALREHFEAQTWYEPIYTADEMDAFGQSIFNDYEIYNLDLITQVETALGYR